MKSFICALVVVSLCLNTATSLAQDSTPEMPAKVWAFLDSMTGTWDSVIPDEGTTGKLVVRWALGGHGIIAEAENKGPQGAFSVSVFLGWDRLSEDGVILDAYSSRGPASKHMKVVSGTVMEGEGTGYEAGKITTDRLRIVRQGPDQFTHYFMHRTLGGNGLPDTKVIFTRVNASRDKQALTKLLDSWQCAASQDLKLADTTKDNTTTRKDFVAFCELFGGRWVSDITWIADFPGLGKKGEKVTAYLDNSLSQDGNALMINFYGGEGSWTEFVTYNPHEKSLNSVWATSGGGMGRGVITKRGQTWVGKGIGSLPDGTTTEFHNLLTPSDHGNTVTIHGSAVIGGKKTDDRHEVWQRVNSN